MKTLQPETECNPEDMGGGGDCIWGPSMTSALRYIQEKKQCLGARRVYTFPVWRQRLGNLSGILQFFGSAAYGAGSLLLIAGNLA